MVQREELIAAGPTDLQVFIVKLARIFEWDIPSLRAPYWRCYVPLSSGGVIRSPGGTDYVMEPGTCFLIPPDTPASTHLIPGRSLLKAYCHFDLNITGVVHPDVYRFPTPESTSNTLAGPVGTTELTLVLIHTAATGLSQLPKTAFESRTIDSRITDVIDMMTRSPSLPMTNTDLAVVADLHVNSFSRLFRHETGMSPQAYSRCVRLLHAAHLLTNSSDSIDQIAEDCGFCDRNHFTRMFTRQWDCPPAEFRRRNRH